MDQEVTAFEPNRLLAWRHVQESLDDKPAPKFTASTEFRIERQGLGGQRVDLLVNLGVLGLNRS